MNENDKSYFADNLKYLRNAKKMDQIDLAKRLGRKSSSSISAWEKGDYTPKAGVLKDIADIFGINLSELMEKDLTMSNTVNFGENSKIIHGDNNEIIEKGNTWSIDTSDRSIYNFGNSDKHNESMQRLSAADLKLQRSLLKKIDEQIVLQQETNRKLDQLIKLFSSFIDD